MAQILSDRDRPERNQSMPPPSRARASGRGVVFHPRVLEAGDKIGRQKRRIGRHADHAFHIRDMRGDPIETGENARERTHKALHIVGDNWETELAKSCRIAIGAHYEALALWP